jgi:hypothetical protein
VLQLTALPLGIGVVLFYLGQVVAQDRALASLTTLLGVAVTFGLTFVFTGDDEPRASSLGKERVSSVLSRLTPVPVLARAGRNNESLAAGPGLAFQF